MALQTLKTRRVTPESDIATQLKYVATIKCSKKHELITSEAGMRTEHTDVLVERLKEYLANIKSVRDEADEIGKSKKRFAKLAELMGFIL